MLIFLNYFHSRYINIICIYIFLIIQGVGKSVFLKRLAIGWAADKEFQDLYEEVIHISLKQVDTNKPVPDVLCQCGYIDQSICEEIEMYFRAVNSRTVLFLLDSVDEVNLDHRCDLFKLITGRLYKNVQILFTARTEAPILECGDIQPEAMITLETLTDETVKSYIDKHAADEAGKAVNKHHLFDLTLLNTPLMLTMWVTNSNYDNIPKNGLEILQRFVDQVMRKKVCNTSCKDVDRFQLELGHFCLDLIMQERSSFPVEGLQSYHLSEVELKTSGMFYRSSDGFYTFTHKRLQEYFAALYIADHGLQYTGFLAFLAKAAKQKSSEEPFTLRRLFRGMEFCMVLVAGIKPSIIEEVISKYKKHLCVATGEVRLDGNPVIFTDLAYEAEVMNGMTDNKTKQVMFRFIANAKGCYRKGMGHDMLDYHRVSQALESIPQKLCQSILQEKRIITEKTDQGYRLKQEPESLNGKWKEKSNHSVKGMVIPQLDCVTACLLKRLQLMSVTHLQVDFSLLMDIQVVLSIFPNLEWLSINGEQNDCLSYCATKTINPLKYLQLMGNYTLSTRSVANVLTTVTADLQKLVIFRTNIFEKMAKKDLTNSQYLNLVEVHIFMPRMYEYGSHLQDLIAKCPHLLHLHLQEDTQGLSGGTRGSWDINMCIALLDCLIYNAKKLIHLSVIDLFNVKSVEYLINHCHMKSLRHIGLSKNDLYDILKLDDPVICISNLKVFHYVNIDEELAEKLSNLQMQNTVVTHMIYDEQGLLCPVSDK